MAVLVHGYQHAQSIAVDIGAVQDEYPGFAVRGGRGMLFAEEGQEPLLQAAPGNTQIRGDVRERPLAREPGGEIPARMSVR
jgi:hypothetical protein